MGQETVKFASSKNYDSVSDSELMSLLICTHGNKEIVVECSDELRETLRELPSDYFQPRLKDLKAYLDKEGISYVEDFKGTHTL